MWILDFIRGSWCYYFKVFALPVLFVFADHHLNLLFLLLCSLMSFSSSESDQSDLRGMGYLVGHHFPVHVHITQYHWYFWDWSGEVTIGWADAAWTVAGWINVTDAAACWVGMTTDAAGWVNIGASVAASTSLALASQLHWKNLGWYPTFIFLGLESFFYIVPGNHITSLDWGGFGSLWKWSGIRPGRIRPISKGIGNGLAFLNVVLHFLLQRREKVWLSYPKDCI